MELLAVVLAALCVLGGVLTVLLVRSRRSHKAQPFRPYIPADAPIKNVSIDHRGISPDVWDMIEEVAVFDDASPDETYELAIGFKSIFGRDKLKIFRNDKNLGYGGNQKRGYRYFMDKGFDDWQVLAWLDVPHDRWRVYARPPVAPPVRNRHSAAVR